MTPAGPPPDIALWTEDWILPDGEKVKVRLIRPADAAIEQAFVHDLSPESRRSRFMGELPELSPETLARFTRVDYPHDLALIVTRIEAGREREIAVARYITLPDGRSCEYAIAVADAWQAHGIGRRLMQALIRHARAGGLERMEGYVLTTNRAMLGLVETLGFEVGPSVEGPQVRLVSLAL